MGEFCDFTAQKFREISSEVFERENRSNLIYINAMVERNARMGNFSFETDSSDICNCIIGNRGYFEGKGFKVEYYKDSYSDFGSVKLSW